MRSISSPNSSHSSTAVTPESTTASSAPALPSCTVWLMPLRQLTTPTAASARMTPRIPATNALRRERPRIHAIAPPHSP